MAIYNFNYEEKNNKFIYKSIDLYYNSLNKKISFDSGNFIKDLYNLNKFKNSLKNNDVHFTQLNNHTIFEKEINNYYDIAYLKKNFWGKLKLYYNKPQNSIMKLYIPNGIKLKWKEFLKHINEK